MSNKFFNINNREQIVTIVEDKGKFYELSDSTMIKKDTFMQKYQPVLEDQVTKKETVIQEGNSTSTLDPDSFFNVPSIPDDVVSGIKKSDPNKVGNVDDSNRTKVVHKGPGQAPINQPSMNESLVKQVPDSPIPNIPNHTNTDVSQYKVYDNDEEAYADFEKKNQSGQPRPQQPKPLDIEQKKMEIELLFDDEKMALGEEEAIARRNKRLLKLPTPQNKQTVETLDQQGGMIDPKTQPTQQLSPIEMMFSTFKRKHDITINVSFEDKIGDPDFVKLMVENMDGDIVGYYKNLIMKNIMKDLSKIEEAVEKEIQLEIFGEITKKETPKPTEKIVLVPGGTTKTGKQKYKYVDSEGNVKELLPESAKSKGYEPYTEK